MSLKAPSSLSNTVCLLPYSKLTDSLLLSLDVIERAPRRSNPVGVPTHAPFAILLLS